MSRRTRLSVPDRRLAILPAGARAGHDDHSGRARAPAREAEPSAPRRSGRENQEPMEALNRTLFLWLNAPAHPQAWLVALATVLAQWLIWAIPALLAIGWLRGDERTRKAMLAATASAWLGLLAGQLIGLAWPHPRPFMIGLGHTLLAHAADPSFPSDHLTLWWAVACALLLQAGLRGTGAALALSGLAIAWARVYLGVHFPFDMLGAAGVAASSAWLAQRAAPWYMGPAYRTADAVHRVLFGRLIARGWVRA